MGIPERIRAGSAALGLSLAEVARKAGIYPQALQQILDGRVRKSKHFPAIAKALSCDVEWLTVGSGMPPKWALADIAEVIRAAHAEQRNAPSDQAVVAGINWALARENARLLAELAALKKEGRGEPEEDASWQSPTQSDVDDAERRADAAESPLRRPGA